MNLIYDDNLNKNVKLWRGLVEDIKILTQKDVYEYSQKNIFISFYRSYATIKICSLDRNRAIGVNGRSVAICNKPVTNLFHIENGNIYGFFYNHSHDLKIGSDIIFVPQVNVYEPNIIVPIMKNFYEI